MRVREKTSIQKSTRIVAKLWGYDREGEGGENYERSFALLLQRFSFIFTSSTEVWFVLRKKELQERQKEYEEKKFEEGRRKKMRT